MPKGVASLVHGNFPRLSNTKGKKKKLEKEEEASFQNPFWHRKIKHTPYSKKPFRTTPVVAIWVYSTLRLSLILCEPTHQVFVSVEAKVKAKRDFAPL